MRKLLVFAGLVLGIALMAMGVTNEYGTLDYGWNADCSVFSIAFTAAQPNPSAEAWFSTIRNLSGMWDIYLDSGIHMIDIGGLDDLSNYGVSYTFVYGVSLSIDVPNVHEGTPLMSPGDSMQLYVDGLSGVPIFTFTVPTCTSNGGEPAKPEKRSEPRIHGVWYELTKDGLELTFENRGDAVGMIYQLFLGPGLHPQGSDDYWAPDSDLWTLILLDQVYVIEPGEQVSFTFPLPSIPVVGLMQTAAERAALFTGFTFDPPHIAIGADSEPWAWVHLVPGWLEHQE